MQKSRVSCPHLPRQTRSDLTSGEEMEKVPAGAESDVHVSMKALLSVNGEKPDVGLSISWWYPPVTRWFPH